MDAGGNLKLRRTIWAGLATNALVRDAPKSFEISKVTSLTYTPVWIRTVFMLPFLWAAVDPLRFIEIHPTPFAEARSAAAYRDTSYFVSLLFGLMTIFATVLTHIFEAGRRHKLPHESGKVLPIVKDKYAAKPSNLQSEPHATSRDA